jgi:hypothetical protein
MKAENISGLYHVILDLKEYERVYKIDLSKVIDQIFLIADEEIKLKEI